MTTRRGFLGLLAAAPVAAPAVAKELSVESSSIFFSIPPRRTFSYVDWTRDYEARIQPLITFSGRPLLGCTIIEGPFLGEGIPNRLYGTTINENGEAV